MKKSSTKNDHEDDPDIKKQSGDASLTAYVMWSIMLSPNSEHLISVAPSIKRAKS